MIATHRTDAPTMLDGFDVLDICHRVTIITLGKLAALVSRLARSGADPEARALARDVVRHFSTVARAHHEDEERHIFPKLLDSGNAEIVQAVQRLQQDHGWIEEDWMALEPHLDALAHGQSGYDLDTLREGVEVFTALMHEHIALEESLIYPQARAGLGQEERLKMGLEMAQRRHARHAAEKG